MSSKDSNNATEEAAKRKVLIIKRARALRSDATDAEKLLWALLRDRQFMGVKFRRQHRIGAYIADFAATEHKLIIELDGGQHANANHVAYDVARTDFLKSEGWQVLRFWNNDVLQNTDGVVHSIAGTLTPPLSLSEGEGAPECVATVRIYTEVV